MVLPHHDRRRWHCGETVSSPWFVDVHSHVVPSGDDGVTTVEEGIDLCRAAFASGTRVLFATPHVHAPWDQYPWSRERSELFRSSFPPIREQASLFGLDLRRGWELFPSQVAELDARAFRLEGTNAVLVEFPGSWLDMVNPLRLVHDAVEHLTALGLTPVLAHPERCRAVAAEPAGVRSLVEAGALLCLNAGSLVGEHGSTAEHVAWRLVDDGVVALAASDGHRARRPATLDRAYAAARAKLGEDRARPLFDGSALPWVDAARSAA
jgi:protein-tyrosine phosphatase